VHVPGLLSDAFGLSRSESRRLIEQGGVSLDGAALSALDVAPADLDGKVLKVGKRRFKRLRAS
jgi:tyrosyl-tRNA synthetase